MPAARQPPRVCARNAERAEIRCRGLRWLTHARTASHGATGVTGLSEPSAIDSPAAAISPNGLSVRARSAPSRAAYMPSVPPHSASNAGCTLATTPRPHEGGDALGVDHLEVLQPVPGPPEPVHAHHVGRRPHPLDDRVGARVADDVEAGLGAGQRAGARRGRGPAPTDR